VEREDFVRCLLVNPAYPETYWSLAHMLPLVRRRWLVAPLPLITVAALLPRHWQLRLVDLAVERLTDDTLRAADVVMLSGMLVQRESLLEILSRCRRLGVRSVVGGPYATAQPERLDEADHLVLGEAEETLPELAADLEAGRARRVYREGAKPDLRSSPVPRYDLLRPGAYHYLAVQFSRGCPFECEFCDIITLYGRTPRTKAPTQVIAELEAIRATGFRGRVMFVDDNFIGPKKAVRALLAALADWRRRTDAPLEFFTEASLDLAERPDLVRAMVAAGFAVVFVGLETPREESLRETRKHQNLGGDPVERVRALRRGGLDVWAGFIVGFDHDDEKVFDEMIDFVQAAGIAYAMVGMLIALPGTALHRRLLREGRLREEDETGDMFAPTNVVATLPVYTLLEGYLRVLATLYAPEVYFARCREHLRHWEPPAGLAAAGGWEDLAVVARSLWRQGVRSPYRSHYWRFLGWALRRHPRKLPLALAQACAGHHFITYTRSTVGPSLRRRLADLPRAAAGPFVSRHSGAS
jgi:radical SAM superfamily enzyme YgiQ (UPF0313 family)